MFNFKPIEKLKPKVLVTILVLALTPILVLNIATYFIIRAKLESVTDNTMDQVLKNSARGRAYAELFSDLNVLRHTFYGREIYLRLEGERLVNKLTAIIQNTPASNLTKPSLDLLNSLVSFVDACTEINIVLEKRKTAHLEIFNLLNRLEKHIGETIINNTIEGKTTTFQEQLLVLVVGYKESLLEIGKEFAELEPESVVASNQIRLMELVDGLILRLQTITASGPMVSKMGRELIGKTFGYRQILEIYFSKLDNFNQQMGSLNSQRRTLLEEMDRVDKAVSASALKINDEIITYILVSRLIVLCISTIITVIVASIILRLFKAMETGIKHRKKAEQDLRRSEKRIQSVFRAAPTGIGVVIDRIFIQANQKICEISGYSEKELIGQSARMLYSSDEDFEYVGNEKYRQIDKSGTGTVETRWRCKDGQIRDILLSSTPINMNQLNEGVTFTALDITERKKSERALKRNEGTLQSFINNLPGRCFLKDAQGRYLLVNTQFVEDLGLGSAEAIIGRNDEELFDPETAVRYIGNDRLVRQAGAPMTFEETLELDGSNRTYLVIKFPVGKVRDPDCLLGGIALDITDSKASERERESLAEQLRQAQKMEAVGTLTGGIAHDFNNILSVIMGYGEIAERKATEGTNNLEEVNQIVEASERARDLVQKILAFSRRSETELIALDLSGIVSRSVKILKRTIPKMIDIKVTLTDGLDAILADSTQLEQVIMNLANNASDAMPDGGRLIFSTEQVTLDSDFADSNIKVTPGEYILLTVTDTGLGMDEKIKDKIFDPFFTTKEIGEGTGLGLSTVYGIIQEHGGAIICDSVLGAGTSFKLYFPALPRDNGVSSDSSPSRFEELMGKETILLVDDEEKIRAIGVEVLKRAGYKILTAVSGEEALEKFSNHQGSLDLVILDLGMPGMGGNQCMKELLTLKPGLKILIASGYSAEGRVQDTLNHGAAGYLAKPFKVYDLLSTVRVVLDS